jgi:hypothetical protein
MHFGTKSYLKSNRYHTVKHTHRVSTENAQADHNLQN